MVADPKSWFPTLPWTAKPAAPVVVRKKRTRAVAELQKKEKDPAAKPLARIALVKRAVAGVETNEEPAAIPVHPERGPQGRVEGPWGFDSLRSLSPNGAVHEDEEMYLDLEPVILEQSRNDEPTLAPRSDEPVAFFEEPDVDNEKPTKALP